MRVMVVESFPRLRLSPGVDNSSTIVNSSSHSIRSSVFAVKGTHFSVLSVELTGKVSGTKESMEKSSLVVAA